MEPNEYNMTPNQYINKLIEEHANFYDLTDVTRAVATACNIRFDDAAIIVSSRAAKILAGCNIRDDWGLK